MAIQESTTLTADGKTDGVQIQGDPSSPRPTALHLHDDIGGGSVAIELAHENVDASYEPMLKNDGTALAITITGVIGLDIPVGMWARIDLTGSTAPNLEARWIRNNDVAVA